MEIPRFTRFARYCLLRIAEKHARAIEVDEANVQNARLSAGCLQVSARSCHLITCVPWDVPLQPVAHTLVIFFLHPFLTPHLHAIALPGIAARRGGACMR